MSLLVWDVLLTHGPRFMLALLAATTALYVQDTTSIGLISSCCQLAMLYLAHFDSCCTKTGYSSTEMHFKRPFLVLFPMHTHLDSLQGFCQSSAHHVFQCISLKWPQRRADNFLFLSQKEQCCMLQISVCNGVKCFLPARTPYKSSTKRLPKARRDI